MDDAANKAHLYPELLTEGDIKVLTRTPPKKKDVKKGACVRCGGFNKGASLGECYRCFGQACQFCATFSFGPRYGYCHFCKEDTFVGAFYFKKVKRTCCMCGSVNEGAKGRTNSGKLQNELDCYSHCTFPGCKTHSPSLVSFNNEGTPRCARHFNVKVPRPLLRPHSKGTKTSFPTNECYVQHLKSGNCPCTFSVSK